MQKLKSYLQLVRLPNLIMMALSMYAVRHFIVIPILEFSGSATQVAHFPFALLVLSVMLIAAGGNIINDYYDVDIDLVNKPGKVIIGKLIAEEKAYFLFHGLSLAGILLAYIPGKYFHVRGISILVIHSGCFLLLWAYAAYLKKWPLIGNILISLLSALTLILVVYYDVSAARAEPVVQLVGGYSAFAFLVSFIRELIKDLEDLPGDLAGGCKTLPVLLGPKSAKRIALFLIITVMLLLGGVHWLQFLSADWLSFAYVSLLLQCPLAFLFYRIWRSQNREHFHFCSLLTKLIMLSGIMSMPVFYYAFN